MIGGAHANGYRTYLPRLADRLPGARLAVVCDSNGSLARSLADKWGFERTAEDWRQVIADPQIGIVSICLPNFMHAEVTEAVISAGKHVICEKPLAVTYADAKRVADKARSAGIVAASVCNYRRVPAITECANLVAVGEIGRPVHILIQYQAEYAADPLLPHSWRYERARAGAGALLDVGPHAIDAARYLCGDIIEIAGAIENIAVTERRLPLEATVGHGHVELSDETRPVDNDDVVSALLKFENGCQGLFSVSRVMTGLGNTLSFAVSGTNGTIRFTSERPGEYQIAHRDGSGAFMVVPNRPASPFSDLMPVPHDGCAVGYGESFSYMIAEFLQAIADGRPIARGTIEDGAKVVAVLEAIGAAITTGRSVAVAN
jgi:predicted dehydrogenase